MAVLDLCTSRRHSGHLFRQVSWSVTNMSHASEAALEAGPETAEEARNELRMIHDHDSAGVRLSRCGFGNSAVWDGSHLVSKRS